MSNRVRIPAKAAEATSFTPAGSGSARQGRLAFTNGPGTERLPAGPGHRFGRVQVHHAAPAGLQAKLTVNEPQDKYEQEADRVADQVMRMPEPTRPAEGDFAERAAGQSTLGTCAACAQDEVRRQPEEEEEQALQRQPVEEEEQELQRQPVEGEEEELQLQPVEEDEEQGLQAKQRAGEVPEVTSRTQRQIESFRNRGAPLPRPVRSHFEPRFGVDLGDVRIHTEPRAAEAARDLRAQAFTTGADIAFASGQFAPGTFAGRRLLAHELTHTLQQNPPRRPMPAGSALTRRNAAGAGHAEGPVGAPPAAARAMRLSSGTPLVTRLAQPDAGSLPGSDGGRSRLAPLSPARGGGAQTVPRLAQANPEGPEAALGFPATARFGHGFGRVPVHPEAATRPTARKIFRSAVASWGKADEEDRYNALLGEKHKAGASKKEKRKAERNIKKYDRQEKRRGVVKDLKGRTDLSFWKKGELRRAERYLRTRKRRGKIIELPEVDRILEIKANYHYFDRYPWGGKLMQVDEEVLDIVKGMFRMRGTPDFWPGIKWQDSQGTVKTVGVRFALDFIRRTRPAAAKDLDESLFPRDLLEDPRIRQNPEENVLALFPIDRLYDIQTLGGLKDFVAEAGLKNNFQFSGENGRDGRTEYELDRSSKYIGFDELKRAALASINKAEFGATEIAALTEAANNVATDDIEGLVGLFFDSDIPFVNVTSTRTSETVLRSMPDGTVREFDETQIGEIKDQIRKEWARQRKDPQLLEGSDAGKGYHGGIGIDWRKSTRVQQHPKYEELTEKELTEKAKMDVATAATYYEGAQARQSEPVTIPEKPKKAAASVIAHEIGHNIGMAHVDRGIMVETLETVHGTRIVRLPDLASKGASSSVSSGDGGTRLYKENYDLTASAIIKENVQLLVNRIAAMTRESNKADLWDTKIRELDRVLSDPTSSNMKALFQDEFLASLLYLPDHDEISSLDRPVIAGVKAAGLRMTYDHWQALSKGARNTIISKTQKGFEMDGKGAYEGGSQGLTHFTSVANMQSF